MTKGEWRTSPTGTAWEYVRSFKGAGRFRVVAVRSEAGAMRYLSEDEWDDWPVIA